MDFPSFLPSTIPAGDYLAEVTTGITEKTSQFDANKTYLEVQMMLQNSRGEYFPFVWAFTAKTPVYRDFLLLFNSKEQISGLVDPPKPLPYHGKFFNVTLTEQAAQNDKTRIVNKIIRITPAQKPEAKPETAVEPAPKATGSEEIPF